MLTGAQQFYYSCPTLTPDKTKVKKPAIGNSFLLQLTSSHIESRVVIDIKSWIRNHNVTANLMGMFEVEDMGNDLTICPCEKCHGIRPHPPKSFPWAEYDLIDPFHDDLELPASYQDKDHRYLLCTNRLMGLSLKGRIWGMPIRFTVSSSDLIYPQICWTSSFASLLELM
jgi:hypothetical protein